MNSFPVPALFAALVAVIALPFSLAAGGTLLITAALGFIIHADYARRCNRVRLPRASTQLRAVPTRPRIKGETHPFAA
jgi:hypothetical protein